MDVDKILADLRRDEGIRSLPYDDFTGRALEKGESLYGNLTGGIGRNLSTVPFSDSEMEFMCRNDIERAALRLDKILPDWRTYMEPRQRALCNMSFNMGDRLADFQQMFAALKAEDWVKASNEALDSAWAKQVGERANRIAELIKNG